MPEALASRALTVLVADDHPLVRDGICHALTQHDVDVCAQAADAPGAVEAALRVRPDVCLLDIEMPGNGIVAAQEIAEQLPETAVVMLTVSDDERDLLAAILAGAVGYLLKDSNPDRLAYALRGVLSGEAALPRRLMTRVLNHVRASETRRRLGLRMPRGVQLTDREWDVLELMHDEMTTRDVATRLSVSPVTVRRHLSAAVAKLGVSDRDAALAMIRDLNVGGSGPEDASEPRPGGDAGAEHAHTSP